MPDNNENLEILDRGDEIKSPLDTAGKPDADKEAADKAAADKEAADKEAADKEAADKKEEGDETPEEKAEREKAEAEAAAKKRIRIPKERLDEAQAIARKREQALLEEIEKLKTGQQTTATQKSIAESKKKIDELQDKYEDLILDGKKDDARKVRKQIDTLRDELVEYQTNVKSTAAKNAAVEELTYNAQLAGLEAKYPLLNPEHADFDEDKVNEVADLMGVFVKSGTKRPDALNRAVKYVLGEPPKAKEKDPEPKDDAAKKLAEEKAAAARKKAAEADKQQPPNSKGVGKDSDKGGGQGEGGVDVMRLSQDKFAKLDADTLAKLRGDEM